MNGFCDQCKGLLAPLEELRYWNVERGEWYCSAQCSLDRHEELRNAEKEEE